MIEIDYKLLETETLDNLLVDIATRQITDNNEAEVNLQAKIADIKYKLAKGDVVIVYDLKEESCALMKAQDLKNFQKAFVSNTD